MASNHFYGLTNHQQFYSSLVSDFRVTLYKILLIDCSIARYRRRKKVKNLLNGDSKNQKILKQCSNPFDFLQTQQNMGHSKNIHLHSCKHKTVKRILTLTLTNTGVAVLTLMLGYKRLRNYKLKRKIQICDCGNMRGVYS